ncbi:hypothetical protein Tco_0776628 [Tanacetum coccineum]
MANLSEDIQCAGSDTRPPMLDRTDFASWQQRIRLYCREGNEGALHLGPERPRVYSDLSPEDKERYNTDIRMLLEGLELTKEDRESQLYDDFKRFCHNKGETIHNYYVRFAKLINDMRNIKMTMSKMQLNSKFVNNMLPEWGRFLTVIAFDLRMFDEAPTATRLKLKLATFKEQVELYERRARFELTKREQKIDEQLRIVITDRNIKEENLKKELHSVKLQLASTINHNKSMVEEVTSLKKDF